MALVFLKKDKIGAEKIRFDLWGTFFSSAGLACFMFGINQLNRFGLKSPMFYLLMGFGFLSLIIFVFVEKQALDPIVDLSLFTNRVFTCALGSLFLMFLTYSAYILLIPFYLLEGIGMTPSRAGVMMTVVSMIAIIVGPISGWLSDRFGQARFATLGAVLTILSFWLIFGFDLNSRNLDIILALALAGLGMGMFQSPNNSSIMGAVGPREAWDRFGYDRHFQAGGDLSGYGFVRDYLFNPAHLSQTDLFRGGLHGAIVDRLAVSLSFSDAFFISAILMSSVVVLSIMTREKK